MLFNSYVFLFLFLPVVIAGWWGLPNKNARLVFLSLASYVFYGWWDYRFVPLMILSSSADFFAGQWIHRASTQRKKNAYLVALLLFNLGLLGFFKYFDFAAQNVNSLSHALGRDLNLPLLHLVLPVGISFYTFNSISYTIDIYRGRLEPARNLLEFSTFVAMYPHLVAGPIVRYSDMHEQFAELPPRPRAGEITIGLWIFTLGMAKKVLIADVLATRFVTPLFHDVHQLGFITAWVATLSYTAQIYFDFSGYSDMAVGLAYLIGLKFPQNFNSPYRSINVSEFWRRWHMSLSFWLRDYVFIPLGGSHGTKLFAARNLMITMFLGGLWHGASWTFVVWGLYHGLLLAIHGALRSRPWVRRLGTAPSIAITFFFVAIGWVFFRAETLTDARTVLAAMFGLGDGHVQPGLMSHITIFPTIWLALALAIAFFLPNTWQLRYPRTRTAALAAAALLLLCTLRFATPSPFLYFQF